MDEDTATEGGFPANPFQDWAGRAYADGGVAASCLALQERHGLDVNLVLWCCWLAASGRGPADRDLLAKAMQAVAPWHGAVVRVLRRVRQELKGGYPPVPAAVVAALRDRTLGLEIDCERAEQLVLLEETPPAAPEPGEDDAGACLGPAARGLGVLFELYGVEPGEADFEDLAVLLPGCFSVPGADAEAALAAAGWPRGPGQQ